ncbi:MAG: hypothetical protein J6K39_02385 [Clostridia bacterium]|nr:hypothetical protein [Clostridia bacterium]
MNKSFEIESDCLDIVKRIKSIDEDYFVVFEPVSQKFQLHARSQGRNSYCLTFPFDTLDERSYFHVLKTRVQNSDELLKMMEEKNSAIEKAKMQEILNDFKEKLYDC